ncbi:MAG: type II secretion system F family protein [Verrucomicrobiota bacterium]
MPEFVYEALKSSGVRVNGVITATTRQEAFRLVMRQGLQPMTLKNEREDKSFTRRVMKKASDDGLVLNKKELLYFTEDLSDLLDAGMQLEPALRTLAQRKGVSRVKDMADALRNQVREGIGFSRALQTTSKSFNDLYCSLVEAGEISGTLPAILKRQADYLSAQMDLQSKVTNALIYPFFLIGASVALVSVFLIYLLPQLTGLLKQTGEELPLMTQVLIGTSEVFANYWWVFFTLIILALLGIWIFLSKPSGVVWWHTNQLKIPLFGPVLETRVFTQLTFTLGTLVSNGIPLLKALQLTNRGTQNHYLKERFQEVLSVVEEGGSLSFGMRKHNVIPQEIIDMIQVGEQTGELGGALLKIARRFEKSLNNKLVKLTTLIQPVIVVGMALLIGLVAYSIFAAIFDTVNSLNVKSGR